jgi:hypothetical protein
MKMHLMNVCTSPIESAYINLFSHDSQTNILTAGCIYVTDRGKLCYMHLQTKSMLKIY